MNDTLGCVSFRVSSTKSEHQHVHSTNIFTAECRHHLHQHNGRVLMEYLVLPFSLFPAGCFLIHSACSETRLQSTGIVVNDGRVGETGAQWK